MPMPFKKDTAVTLNIPLRDNTGALKTGAGGLDAYVSKDGGAFNQITDFASIAEIGSKGIYEVPLAQAEMNADRVTVVLETSTVNVFDSEYTMYPSVNTVDDFFTSSITIDASGNTEVAVDSGGANTDTLRCGNAAAGAAVKLQTTATLGAIYFDQAGVNQAYIAQSTSQATRLDIIKAASVTTLYTDMIIQTTTNAVVGGTLAVTGTSTLAAANLSGNLQVNGGDIGIAADTDLLQLASGALTVNGSITNTAGFSLGGNLVLTAGNQIGITADTDLMIMSNGVLQVNGMIKYNADYPRLGDGTNFYQWKKVSTNLQPYLDGASVPVRCIGLKVASGYSFQVESGNVDCDGTDANFAYTYFGVTATSTFAGQIIANCDIGVTGDLDLLQLASGTATVNGHVVATGNLTCVDATISGDVGMAVGKTLSVNHIALSWYDDIFNLPTIISDASLSIQWSQGSLEVADNAILTTTKADGYIKLDTVSGNFYFALNTSIEGRLFIDGSDNFLMEGDGTWPRLGDGTNNWHCQKSGNDLVFYLDGVAIFKWDEAGQAIAAQ